MADAEPEQEATRKRLVERALRVRHRHRVARVDVRDAGGDLQFRGRRQQQRRGDERVATDRLRDPQRGEAELLDPPGDAACLLGWNRIEDAGPDPDPAEVESLASHQSARPSPPIFHVVDAYDSSSAFAESWASPRPM